MVRKTYFLRLAALVMVLLTFMGCTTKATDTGALRADLDALELELDKVAEENARLKLKVEDLEIELEKQKLILEEAEAALAELSSVSETYASEAVAMAVPEQDVSPEAELVSPAEPSLSQPTAEEPAIEDVAESSPPTEATNQPVDSAQPSTETLQATEPEPETKSAATSSQVQVGDTVYITKTGKKYHTNPACNGANYFECSLEDAIAKGLTPCKKCAGG